MASRLNIPGLSAAARQLLHDCDEVAQLGGNELPDEGIQAVIAFDKYMQAMTDVIADKVAARLKAAGVGAA